jgi:hypothetical protein
MIKLDASFVLTLEIIAVLYGAPALVLMAAATLVIMRTWRFSSGVEAARKLVAGGIVVALALLLGWGAFLVGFGTLLEHPSYRSHIICEPCF